MTALQVALFALAGIGSGLAGSVAGIASIVAYPALLGLGLPPVSANVTATVANVFGGIGSSVGSRPELVGQRQRLRRLVGACLAGGTLGSALLLLTPGGLFARVVPWLIGGASLAILARPAAPGPADVGGVERDPKALAGVAFAIAVYAGYFGAAAGVLMVVVLVHLASETIPRATGAKNVSLLAANAVAAVAYAAFGPVHWAAVAPLAVGFFVGGRLGPLIVRRVAPSALRVVIAAGGLGLAVHLALGAYR